MANYYLSKNYTDISSAGNKAKTDIEQILSGLGYKSAGLAQTVYSNKITGFILTLMGVLRMFFTLSANDFIVIQYPFKKYYSFACRIAHFKKGKVITVVHDLGVFRRKRLSVDEEMARLSHTDYLIVHNESMKNWLLRHGYSKPMVSLSIFDYLSSSVNTGQDTYGEGPIKVIYAGGLSYKKNRYLYALDDIISNWQFELYGSGFEEDKIKNKKQFKYHGFCPSDRLIETVSAHYGLVWDGESASACSGNYGEYLKINNPHKASLYIRCNLPVIIWKEAALAPFVMKHKIGLCIGSIDELNTALPAVSVEEYNEMKRNIRAISANLSSGFYLTNALSLIESLAH